MYIPIGNGSTTHLVLGQEVKSILKTIWQTIRKGLGHILFEDFEY